MTATGQRHWLTLARCPGLGPRSFQRLITTHGSAADICAANTTAWREAGIPEAGRTWLAQPDNALLDADEAWLAGDNRYLIPRDDPRYPTLLAELPDAPAWLFAHGDPDLLCAPAFAIVGSRNPSPAGLGLAADFAAALAANGLVVASGLADGIDAAAHRGALQADGMTVAVCGTGLDRVYPARNRQLAQNIAANGLLLSEFALGMPPMRAHFPRRNRIIAGLSLGTLVVEAARNSGSLITARMARDYGREVFALPGSIHNPLARGCHRLIREGAKLVETAADILEEIAPQLPAAYTPVTAERPAQAPLDPEYARLMEYLGNGPARIDALVEKSGLTADAVSSMLLILELQGLVASAPGGAFVRIK